MEDTNFKSNTSMIPNTNPITAPDFNGLWVSSCVINFPAPGCIQRTLKPYNGADVLNREVDTKATSIPAGAVDLVLTQMAEWLQTHFGNTSPVSLVQVDAPYPDRPVVAYVYFQSGNGTIPDCFALAATDSEFENIFVQAMNLVAQ